MISDSSDASDVACSTSAAARLAPVGRLSTPGEERFLMTLVRVAYAIAERERKGDAR